MTDEPMSAERAEDRRSELNDLLSADWVTVNCTSPVCRGRKYDGKGFEVTVPRGREQYAVCNECFCR